MAINHVRLDVRDRNNTAFTERHVTLLNGINPLQEACHLALRGFLDVLFLLITVRLRPKLRSVGALASPDYTVAPGYLTVPK